MHQTTFSDHFKSSTQAFDTFDMSQFHKNMYYTGFLRSLEQYGKKFCHFPVWRRLENFFWSLSMEEEI